MQQLLLIIIFVNVPLSANHALLLLLSLLLLLPSLLKIEK